jgi:ketosteroid isomerase-like protein
MKARHAMLMGLLGSMLFAPALRAQSEARPSEMEQLRAAAAQLADAYGRQDLSKIQSLYTDDAIFLPDDAEMLRGKEALRKYLGAETGTREFQRHLLAFKIDGDLAYEIANQTVTIRVAGRPPRILKDKYLHVWKKQKDGSWKVLIDMYNWRSKTP